jgi:hypothetical protein
MQYRFTPRRAGARALLLSLALAPALTNCQAAPLARNPQPQRQTAPAAQTTAATPAQPAKTAQPAPGTPSAVVREFYKLLRERRFREAFAVSIWRPAVEGLSADDFEELRPEFEKMAEGVPEQFDVSGEQISGDQATVFVRTPYDAPGQFQQHPLIRTGGAWVYGNKENQQAVNKDGREFFFKARVERHHDEVVEVLKRIAEAEALYAATHGGLFADLPALLQDSRLSFREEMKLAETLGYNFRVALSDGGRSYRVNAEPAKYGRTGRLSFSWQDGLLQKKDTGGKPYNPPAPKKKK